MYSPKKIVCLILVLISINSLSSFAFGLVEPTPVSRYVQHKNGTPNITKSQNSLSVYPKNSKITEKEEQDSVSKKATSITTLIAGFVKSIGDFIVKSIVSLINSLLN